MFVTSACLTEFHNFGDLFQTLRTLECALIVIRLLRFNAHKKHQRAACRAIWMSNDLLGLNAIGDLHGHLPILTGGSAIGLSATGAWDCASAGDAGSVASKGLALGSLYDLGRK